MLCLEPHFVDETCCGNDAGNQDAGNSSYDAVVAGDLLEANRDEHAAANKGVRDIFLILIVSLEIKGLIEILPCCKNVQWKREECGTY
jgi:hypothetical protein